MEIVFLGTGDAFASGGRNPLAILLRSKGTGVLLDCGPSTLVALKQAGLAPDAVDVVLLSHHHGDHFAGVPFLVLHERYESERSKPLSVFGPRGTDAVVTAVTELFFPGLGPLPFPLELHDLEPEQATIRGALSFEPFEVDHFSSGVAFGYRVRLGDKTVVYSGDTAWTEALVGATADADLFICECSSFERPLARHLSHRDLREHGSKLGARRTVLVHAGEDVIEKEHELVFELARDGMRIEL